jgi:DNA-binding transcriptional LysR family regulator
MALEIKSLYYFSVLAASDSFTQAAGRLYISQQALSKHIQGLEKQLGQALIDRRAGGGLQLSAVGKLFLKQSEPLLAHILTLEQHLALPLNGSTETVRIGAALGLHGDLLEFLKHPVEGVSFHPEVTLPVEGSPAIESLLLTHQLDLGVLPHAPISSQLSTSPLPAVPYAIVGAAAQDLPWWDLRYLAFEEIHAPDHGDLNRWPEQQWPRQIVARVDIAMALEMVAVSDLCVHIPRHFVDFKQLEEVCEAPFAAVYTPHLVWKQDLKPSPLLSLIKAYVLREVTS